MRWVLFCGVAGLVSAPMSVAAQDKAAAPAPVPTAAAPQAKLPSPIPLELFARLPFMESPKLSPNGTKVATRLAIKGVQRLAIIPLDDFQKTRQLSIGDSDLNGWAWVNDDWLVAKVGAVSNVGGSDWYIRRAVGVSADGKAMQILGKNDAAQNADDLLWIASDGSPNVLLAMQTSVFSDDPGFWPEVLRFDVSTGKGKRVQNPVAQVFDWYADGAGTVRMGIAYDDDRRSSRLLYRDNADASFRTVVKARGKDATLGNVPAMFLPEPGKAVAYDDADGFDAVYDLDLASLKTGNKLFGVAGYDVDDLITGAGGTKMIGAAYVDNRPRTHWFDPVLAKVQTDLDKAVGTRQALITSWSRDFSTLIVYVGGADRPGAYYLYRLDDGVMHVLARVNEDLGNDALSPVKTIRYKARDGLEIQAVLTMPKGGSTKNLPLILMPHGGPFARDDESWDWWAQFLASRGYAVLQPNYRGSSGFGNAFAEKGRGQWGLAMQDDLTDAVKWAVGEGIADAKRVCIVGGSYGGYAAFRAAQRDKGVYRCAVSYAGVADLPAMVRYDGSFLNSGRRKDWLRAQAPDLKAVSPINYAADFSIPILIMHGKADRVVPVKQSREMVEKLKAAGKPYRYVEQPKGDHHFSEEADRVQWLKELEAFLKENNPA